MRSLLATCVLLTVASICSAATYLIQPDGTGDFPTIQDAIDAGIDGDVVVLADGTFAGDGNRDLDYAGKAITIRSVSGAAACTIDCGGESDKHRGFYFHTGEGPDSRLEGVTIANGFADARGIIKRNEDGGAIVCVDGASPSLVDCVFVGNTAQHSGGALFCRDGASPTVAGCRFEGNTAVEGDGGGICCHYGCSLFVDDCDFGGNAAVDGGGANCAWNCTLTMQDCRFVENALHGGGSGSGINILGATASLSGCLFTGHERSGALACSNSDGVLVDHCTFANNVANGLLVWNATMTVRSCTFYANVRPDPFSPEKESQLWIAGSSVVSIERTIIALTDRGASIYVGSGENVVELSNCDIFGHPRGDWLDPISEQLGTNCNIWANPEFCDPPNGNFNLQDTSPCASGDMGCGELMGAWDGVCGMTSPTVDFAASPLFGPAPLQVLFGDLSTGFPDGWSWEFGDGTTSTDRNPLHEYDGEGSYTVTLTVTFGGSSLTEMKSEYVSVTPALGDNSMHVSDLGSTYIILPGNKYQGLATPCVRDAMGERVVGAEVLVSWTSPNGAGTVVGVTENTGCVQIRSERVRNAVGPWCCEVVNISHATYVYDPQGNIGMPVCSPGDGDGLEGVAKPGDLQIESCGLTWIRSRGQVIRYTLPEAGRVTLSIFNALGRKLAVVGAGWHDAGEHEVRFDPTALSSGVYYYRLEAGELRSVQKVVLVK